MPAINISIDKQHGVIRCDPKGGHLHTRSKGTVDWVGQDNLKFTLIFENLDTQQEAPWPFSNSKPDWPCTSFSGTFAAQGLPFYKYIVRVKDYDDLDPIIIVDRN